jgi:hypothetical protein
VQNILGTSGAISRPDGTAHLLVEVSRHFVPGYSHWVPSSFASPFREKTGRQVDYGGQAGTICANKIYRSALSTSGEGRTYWWKFPGTSCQATFIRVPSSFVSPFQEKTRRRVDYGGQAGINLYVPGMARTPCIAATMASVVIKVSVCHNSRLPFTNHRSLNPRHYYPERKRHKQQHQDSPGYQRKISIDRW